MEEIEMKKCPDEELSPISVLLDEVLEEIFVHLPGREQLNCRLVCHHWDNLLCDCSRLLQNTVQLSIDISSSEINLAEHELIPIIKANSALKVKRFTVDCDVFVGENPMSVETVIDFIREYNIGPMVEFFSFSVNEECNAAEILYKFLSIFTKLKKFKLNTCNIEPKAEYYIKFDEKWQTVTFPTIARVGIETWGVDDYQLWSPTLTTFLLTVLGRMPNIKCIYGFQGYNEEFYQRYAHLLEIDRLNIHDISNKIVFIKSLNLRKLHLHGDSDYVADEFWYRLNRYHPELKTLSLTYSTKGAPVPVHDYSKVTDLDLCHSFGEASEENLSGILIHFPSIKNLYLSGSITKECFFGHTRIELPKLREAKIFLEEDCKLTCDECIECYTKCLCNVEELNIDAVSMSLLKCISKNMKKLKKLSFSTTPDPKIFSEWPEMPSLEHLIFRYGLDSISIKDIQNLNRMCPKLDSLDFEDSVSIRK
uniref:CSON003183 protein n=1 Tax=Culicoides sonorensis TaxID=179676 RepID=A0A336KCR4_CULSO